MGNGHGGSLAQRIGLLLRQHPALPVEPGEQVGRASLASGAQSLQRLSRKVRRLGQQLDHSPAAEPQAPQLISLGRVVDGDQHRCVEPQRLARKPRSLLLQASAADQPDRSAVLGNKQPRAGSAVGGASDRDHGRKRERLAARLAVGRRVKDRVELAHTKMLPGATRRGTRAAAAARSPNSQIALEGPVHVALEIHFEPRLEEALR